MHITDIKHLKDHQLTIYFSDGKNKVIDLASFIENSGFPWIDKYKDVNLFKNFEVDDVGAPRWGGNEWDINPTSIINGDFDVKKTKRPRVSKKPQPQPQH